MSKALKVLAVVLVSAAIGIVIGNEARRWWPPSTPQPKPQIYKMQFGATVNKFIVLGGRLHLVVPLPVTGESGRIIEIDKVSKKGRGK